MSLPNKTFSIDEAIKTIADGASIMLGGFGVPGTPFCLIDALVKHGAKNLTIIKNDANETGMGVDHLIQNGQVSRLITTHIGLNANAIEKMNEKQIEVELCPQGILAERIRSGGAGLIGFLTDIAVGTELAQGKKQYEIDGKKAIFEPALRADFALLHADCGDQFGNLTYVSTAQNFNPLMAMAADHVIAEVETLKPLGGLDPNHIHTAGPFVDQVVHLTALTGEYAIVER